MKLSNPGPSWWLLKHRLKVSTSPHPHPRECFELPLRGKIPTGFSARTGPSGGSWHQHSSRFRLLPGSVTSRPGIPGLGHVIFNSKKESPWVVVSLCFAPMIWSCELEHLRSHILALLITPSYAHPQFTADTSFKAVWYYFWQRFWFLISNMLSLLKCLLTPEIFLLLCYCFLLLLPDLHRECGFHKHERWWHSDLVSSSTWTGKLSGSWLQVESQELSRHHLAHMLSFAPEAQVSCSKGKERHGQAERFPVRAPKQLYSTLSLMAQWPALSCPLRSSALMYGEGTTCAVCALEAAL
jgi:hypothetical protein